MIKYVDTAITFSEVPDEITLCINISNCPCKCLNCHSSYLSKDIGIPLTTDVIDKYIINNKGITCISFMGGDSNPLYINNLAKHTRNNWPNIKVAWYSGKQELSEDINLVNFNYIKLGPYNEELGPLNNPNTNQRFYKVANNNLEDITYKFWNNKNGN